MVNRNHKSLHKVAEDIDLNMGKMIYLDIISKKKPSYGGYKNWILFQDFYTKQKYYFFMKAKWRLTEKFSLFLNKTNTTRENA